jgi:hypothetical protein
VQKEQQRSRNILPADEEPLRIAVELDRINSAIPLGVPIGGVNVLPTRRIDPKRPVIIVGGIFYSPFDMDRFNVSVLRLPLRPAPFLPWSHPDHSRFRSVL